jgi:hypothetical protein
MKCYILNWKKLEEAMPTRKVRKSEANLEKDARKFLHDHPEAKKTLDLFGIAFDRYKLYLAAQHNPKFYTATSTIEGEQNGELD